MPKINEIHFRHAKGREEDFSSRQIVGGREAFWAWVISQPWCFGMGSLGFCLGYWEEKNREKGVSSIHFHPPPLLPPLTFFFIP